jgi:DNA topoisomerase-1
MVVRRGRRGAFLACSGYPECKNTRPMKKREEPEPAGVDCPECGKPMLKRRSRRGAFLGCSGYPDCKKTMSLKAAKSDSTP